MKLFGELTVAKNNQGRRLRIRAALSGGCMDIGILCNVGSQTLGQGPEEVMQLS